MEHRVNWDVESKSTFEETENLNQNYTYTQAIGEDKKWYGLAAHSGKTAKETTHDGTKIDRIITPEGEIITQDSASHTGSKSLDSYLSGTVLIGGSRDAASGGASGTVNLVMGAAELRSEGKWNPAQPSYTEVIYYDGYRSPNYREWNPDTSINEWTVISTTGQSKEPDDYRHAKILWTWDVDLGDWSFAHRLVGEGYRATFGDQFLMRYEWAPEIIVTAAAILPVLAAPLLVPAGLGFGASVAVGMAFGAGEYLFVAGASNTVDLFSGHDDFSWSWGQLATFTVGGAAGGAGGYALNSMGGAAFRRLPAGLQSRITSIADYDIGAAVSGSVRNALHKVNPLNYNYTISPYGTNSGWPVPLPKITITPKVPVAPKSMHVGNAGHHVPAVRKSRGRPFDVERSDLSRPTIHVIGDEATVGQAHWRMHNAERTHIGPRQGDFVGTDDELFEAYRQSYRDLTDIRVDVRSPDGSTILGRNVSLEEAVNLLESFLRGS